MAQRERRCDCKQVVVALVLEEPSDLADNKVAGVDAELGAQGQVVLCVKERLQIEAAEDARVVLRLADAGGEVLLRHRVGHGDEVRGDAARVALGGAEGEVRQ